MDRLTREVVRASGMLENVVTAVWITLIGAALYYLIVALLR